MSAPNRARVYAALEAAGLSELDIVTGARTGSSRDSLEAGHLSYPPEPLLRRMLAVADVLAIVVAAVFVGLWGSGVEAAFLLVLLAPVWIVSAKLAGLYDRDHRTLRHLTVDELPWLVVWALSSTAVLTLLLVPFPALDLSSDDRLLVWGTALGLGFAFRATMRAVWRRITPPQRMLIVGDGPLAQAVVRKLELFPDIHAAVSGRVENCALLHDRVDEVVPTVDRVVVACRELGEDILEKLLPACRLHGVKLTIVPPTRGMFGTATNLTHIADLPLLDYNTWDISRMTMALKRSLDVLLAIAALVCVLPLLLVVALATLVDSRGPIFFRQVRGGERGRPFQMLKFRTMVKNAEAMLPELVPFEQLDAPMFKLKADPRVTRVGRLLRRTSIDELPQLINVLRGEMSIVGPRPEQLDLVERYAPEHQFRLQVKPGITGPMQVYGRGELTFEERLAVEREYVENLSLMRDIRIVLMTLPAVLGRRGAY
ncbi:MAG TPA: exopolysaccharide biosynthesis polyprenyl glycosylphosphotransferase [Gaiellaceae bacterium]|nr:exopolysaccharide biosynthesis polyprenyl glycosylphosphotransferase [Gaiellaceae bacterium]